MSISEKFDSTPSDQSDSSLWQLNVQKRGKRYYDLTGEPLDIRGSFTEGLPLTNQVGRFAPDEEASARGLVGIYLKDPNSPIEFGESLDKGMQLPGRELW